MLSTTFAEVRIDVYLLQESTLHLNLPEWSTCNAMFSKELSIPKKITSGKDQSGNRLRKEFSPQFLHGMSDLVYSDFDPKKLERFLNDKFEFFSGSDGETGTASSGKKKMVR